MTRCDNCAGPFERIPHSLIISVVVVGKRICGRCELKLEKIRQRRRDQWDREDMETLANETRAKR